VRLTIGAMFVWVFFENLGKGLYTPAGYAGLINYYIKSSLSFARTLHVSQHKRIAPITVRLIRDCSLEN
jgi:hypothetical protein